MSATGIEPARAAWRERENSEFKAKELVKYRCSTRLSYLPMSGGLDLNQGPTVPCRRNLLLRTAVLCEVVGDVEIMRLRESPRANSLTGKCGR